MSLDFLNRDSWGEPIAVDTELASYREGFVRDILFSGDRSESSWESEDLSFDMVGHVLKRNSKLTNAVIAAKDSPATVGEISFMFARYPKLYIGASTDTSFLSPRYRGLLQKLRTYCTDDESLAWIFIYQNAGWVPLTGRYLLDDVAWLSRLEIPFDVSVPFVNLGIYDAEVIRRALDEDIDPRLLAP